MTHGGRPSLREAHPELIPEWHPTKNTSLTPDSLTRGSKKKVWWLCAVCDHEWEAPPKSRTGENKRGCPECGKRKSGASRKRPKPGESLAELHPELALQWHPDNPDTPADLKAQSHEKRLWLCPKPDCDEIWPASLDSRVRGRGCPECGKEVKAAKRAAATKGVNDLASLRPDLVADWHPDNPEQPDEICFKSNKTRQWRCSKPDCDWEWPATVDSRAAGAGCPACAGLTLVPGANDLATVKPELAKEWHPKNPDSPSDVAVKTQQMRWWLCSTCGYPWEAVVAGRSDGRGCPACDGKVVVPGFNDLASQNPRVALEWHPENPDTPRDVTSASNRKRRWRCLLPGCEGDWVTTVFSRKDGNGCPECADWGFSPMKAACLYLIEGEIRGNRVLKLGICNKLEQRVKQHKWHSRVLDVMFFDTGVEAAGLETRLRHALRDRGVGLYATPQFVLSGRGEAWLASEFEAVSLADVMALGDSAAA